MATRALALSCLCVFVALAAAGCGTVCMHERETLASARMRLDDPSGEAFLVRGMVRAREEGHIGAGGGGAAGGGGGCGCN